MFWNRKYSLDEPLLCFDQHDRLTIRNLLDGGLLIMGRSGSGKTSSSGRRTAEKIVSHPKSAGLAILPKMEDLPMWKDIFRKAGRLKDMIVFDEKGKERCNFFGCCKTPRDVTTLMATMSEVLKRRDGKGGSDSHFYEQLEERINYDTVTALQTAREPITPKNMHSFIVTAASTGQEMQSPQWQQQYQAKVLDRGDKMPKTPMQEHDFNLCLDLWTKEWLLMDPKTRGNALAGVQNTLFVMNSGLVREMTSGTTTFSPLDAMKGRWIITCFPPSTYGANGLLLSVGMKQLMEDALLGREADGRSPFCTIWCDEAHQFVTYGVNGDNNFIAQCRSRKGCLVYLTQSVSSFYASTKGETGRAQADSLLANFSTVIAHPVDPPSAKWLSAKLGQHREILYSGGSSPRHDATVWDALFSDPGVSCNYSEQYQPVLHDQEFMIGRTGGPTNRYLCDAIVIKNGSVFSDGQSYKRVVFSQK